jgi:hypothetical protein
MAKEVWEQWQRAGVNVLMRKRVDDKEKCRTKLTVFSSEDTSSFVVLQHISKY